MDANFEYYGGSPAGTVMIENRFDRNFQYASMYHFGSDSMYCGSDKALEPGTVVTILFDDRHLEQDSRLYLGKVRSCEEFQGSDNANRYGLGIKIIETIHG